MNVKDYLIIIAIWNIEMQTERPFKLRVLQARHSNDQQDMRVKSREGTINLPNAT